MSVLNHFYCLEYPAAYFMFSYMMIVFHGFHDKNLECCLNKSRSKNLRFSFKSYVFGKLMYLRLGLTQMINFDIDQ